MHYHLTNTQLLVGGFILALFLLFALSALLDRFRKKPAPFKNYFFYECDHNLRQSPWSDDEDGTPDRQSRFTPFRLRDSRASEWRTKVGGATRWDHESD